MLHPNGKPKKSSISTTKQYIIEKLEKTAFEHLKFNTKIKIKNEATSENINTNFSKASLR